MEIIPDPNREPQLPPPPPEDAGLNTEETDKAWAESLGLKYDPPAPPPLPPTPDPQAPIQPAFPEYRQPEPMPDTFLVWSILSVILCCFIPGVVAIIYSAQVSSKYYAKDYEGSRKASERAQLWIIISIVLGVISAALYLPISLLGS